MKLSIITINLNNKYGLQKTVESVISQTFIDYEYIIIDGASTDGSVDIIKQNESKITYWISEPDKGIYNAMNKGILQANGEYCLFLNSGDRLIDERVLEKVFLLNYSEDIIYGNIIKIFSDNEKKRFSGVSKSNPTLCDLLLNFIPHQASLIKTNLFIKYGLYSEEYKIASDHKFFIDSIIFGNVSVKYINMDISYYDTTGVSSTLVEETFMENNAIHESLFPIKVLQDIEELTFYRKSRVINIYNKLRDNLFIVRLYNLIFHGKAK